jgi:hypothetical protein
MSLSYLDPVSNVLTVTNDDASRVLDFYAPLPGCTGSAVGEETVTVNMRGSMWDLCYIGNDVEVDYYQDGDDEPIRWTWTAHAAEAFLVCILETL